MQGGGLTDVSIVGSGEEQAVGCGKLIVERRLQGDCLQRERNGGNGEVVYMLIEGGFSSERMAKVGAS